MTKNQQEVREKNNDIIEENRDFFVKNNDKEKTGCQNTVQRSCIDCKNATYVGVLMKDYIEERAISIANYIIENNATVRQTAKQFGISKSTVHVVVRI